jgi:hypothetical protein
MERCFKLSIKLYLLIKKIKKKKRKQKREEDAFSFANLNCAFSYGLPEKN